MSTSSPTPIPMFEQRRIEAMILKHVYDTLKASHGIEVAQKAIADAVRASSIEQAKMFAAKVGGKTSIQTFVDRQSLWKIGGAMEMEVKEQTETSYVFNVTRCKYAEMVLLALYFPHCFSFLVFRSRAHPQEGRALPRARSAIPRRFCWRGVSQRGSAGTPWRPMPPGSRQLRVA